MKAPFDRPYLLHLTREQVDGAESDDILAAIYAPGLICNFCFEWLQYGLVCENGLIGRECAYENGYGNSGPWLKALQAGRCFSMPGEFLTFRGLRPGAGGLLRGLSLSQQLEPQHGFAAGMYKLLMEGKTLTPKQAQAVRRMLAERGGWKAMLTKRDRLVRLKRFAWMNAWTITSGSRAPIPGAADLETIASLERAAWAQGLSIKQERLLHVIEERYYLLRHQYSEDLARQLNRNLTRREPYEFPDDFR